ncbi:MAG: DNA polymerase III subunit beta [Phycisphaerae bacterium]|nr:MAG: DNA polymerase III subunit beta [Phycisphaerae bacterium]
MKVRMNRQELAEALVAVGSVAASRTPKEILECTMIEAHKDHCVLIATNLEIGIRYTVAQVEVDETGPVVVAADKLTQIVRESTDDVLEFSSDDSICHVRGTGAHYQIYTKPPAEFPPTAELSGEPDLTVDAGLLRRMSEWTVLAAARENTRYAINGVLWDRKGKELVMVATDGRRLSQAKGKLDSADGGDLENIVPVKTMGIFQRVLGPADSTVAIKATGNQLVFKTAKATISTSLVEGQFPKYQDVIPAKGDRLAKMKTADLLSAVKRSALLTNEESKGVRMAFSADNLKLTSRAPTQGESMIEIPIEYSGADMEIGFNPTFLVEALRAISAEEVRLELSESNRPGVLRGDEGNLYVVMPVNLS